MTNAHTIAQLKINEGAIIGAQEKLARQLEKLYPPGTTVYVRLQRGQINPTPATVSSIYPPGMPYLMVRLQSKSRPLRRIYYRDIVAKTEAGGEA